MGNLPQGFYANVLREAFPEDHTYKVALFEKHKDFAIYDGSDECGDDGYETGGKVLTGYKVNDFGDYATVTFNRTVDWFDATIRTKSAVVYDANTGIVMNIMNFERTCGVIGGVFTLSLHEDGVVQLGERAE